MGGAAGAVTRYLVSEAAKWFFGGGFPIATLIVNVVGCLLLGLIIGVSRTHSPQFAHPIIAVGFLGALTTFSTFSVETIELLHAGQWKLSLTNVAAQLVIGLFAAWLGLTIARGFQGETL